MAFLGAVGEAAAKAAWASLPPMPPFAVTLAPLEPMGDLRRGYSALSAGIADGRAALEAWMKPVAAAARHAAGRGPDRWPGIPHLTLARPQRAADEDDRRRGLE